MKDTVLTFEQTLQKFDPVLGFEVHVELNTATKMFCACPNTFGDKPNTNVCPICLGLPGALPMVNTKAVESAIKIGLALNCEIATNCRFARKNYFYPDTPKNFQTSQYEDPICYNGNINIEMSDGTIFKIEIERAHMEEDAGKLNHIGGSTGRIQGAQYSLIDYNRAGVPLIEIVTKPITGAGKYAPELGKKYLTKIKEIVKNLEVSYARMERGHVRCDANVSLRPHGTTKFGTRTETKNMNSFRAVEKAVHYEMTRHAAILSNGNKILQETRHWHEDTGTTTSGRPKSDADDYRYFPEPDLVLISPEPQLLDKLRKELPQSATSRHKRLQQSWGYTDLEFRDVLNANLLEPIEETINAGATPPAARKWWMGEIARRAKIAQIEAVDLGISVETIIEIERLIAKGSINDRLARDVLDGVLAGEGNPSDVIKKRNLAIVSNDAALLEAIDAALLADPEIVKKIKQGKTQAAGAIVGVVMRNTGGKADPNRVRQLVLERAAQ